MKHFTQRNIVIGVIALVAAYLLWSWYKAKRSTVLDPSNSSSLSNLFDQQNPTVPGTQDGSFNTGFVAPQIGSPS